MRIFKTLLLSLFFLTIAFIPLQASVSAVEIGDVVCSDQIDEDQRPDICADLEQASDPDDDINPLYGPDGIITRAVTGLSLVIGVIAIIVIIIAGIRMTLSSGDSGQVKSARDAVIYAAVGLIIAVLAQAIVRVVLNRVGV